MENKLIKDETLQGKYQIELKFVDDRVFLNYWDWKSSKDVCTQIIDGKIKLFVYSEDEVNDDDFDEDAFEQKEVSITEFIGLVKKSIQQ